jgi:uncharacterized membrane protein YheB (UPF0754 family)
MEIKFDNLSDVLRYLKYKGRRVSRASLYRHAAEGKLLAATGGTYKQRTVDRYAKAFLKLTDTGKRISVKGQLREEDLVLLQTKRIMLENGLLESRAAREKLKLAKEEGLLVSVQDVLDEAFIVARATRDALLNIPNRITPIVAAETNENKVRDILTRELHDALENFSIKKFEELKKYSINDVDPGAISNDDGATAI